MMSHDLRKQLNNAFPTHVVATARAFARKSGHTACKIVYVGGVGDDNDVPKTTQLRDINFSTRKNSNV